MECQPPSSHASQVRIRGRIRVRIRVRIPLSSHASHASNPKHSSVEPEKSFDSLPPITHPRPELELPEEVQSLQVNEARGYWPEYGTEVSHLSGVRACISYPLTLTLTLTLEPC